MFLGKPCSNIYLMSVLEWLDEAALDSEDFIDGLECIADEDFIDLVDLAELAWPAPSLFLTNSAYSASLVIFGISSAKFLFFKLDVAVSARLCIHKLTNKVVSITKAIDGLSFIAVTTYAREIYDL